MIKSGTLKNRNAIDQQYSKQIKVYKEKMFIEYSFDDIYTITEEIVR